ncbi:MAG: hypothetical protein ACNI25_01825 [Halarcobacter sp.]
MSDNLIKRLNSFNNYKYNHSLGKIENLKSVKEADLDEFLEIANILDRNFIKYSFSTNIDITIIKSRK